MKAFEQPITVRTQLLQIRSGGDVELMYMQLSPQVQYWFDNSANMFLGAVRMVRLAAVVNTQVHNVR